MSSKTSRARLAKGARLCVIVGALPVFFVGCGDNEWQPDEAQSSASADEAIANPSAEYCTNLGYRLEVRASEAGEHGVCIFADGTECNSWAFFRGECGAEHSYCAKQGAKPEHREETVGSARFAYQVCVFDDGSECLVNAYMGGTCAPGQCRRVSMKDGCEAPRRIMRPPPTLRPRFRLPPRG